MGKTEMREILFRGKRVDNGEWVEGSLVNNIFFRVGTSVGVTYIINPDVFVEVIPETVGQFTGLTDKNGKKIFEGDIVKSITHFYGNQKERITVISFEEIENDSFGEPYTIGYAILGSEYEVIGNIHDEKEVKMKAIHFKGSNAVYGVEKEQTAEEKEKAENYICTIISNNKKGRS